MLDVSDDFYFTKIDKSGTNNLSNIAAISLTGRSPKIRFHKSSGKGIVFNIRKSAAEPHVYMISTDGGTSWTGKTYAYTDANELSENYDIQDAYSFDGDNIILAGGSFTLSSFFIDKAFILKTTDGGLNWTKIDVDAAKGFNSLTFIDNDEGFAAVNQVSASSESKLFHTGDSGVTWSPVPDITNPEGIVRTQFFGTYYGIAVGHKGTIFRYSIN